MAVFGFDAFRVKLNAKHRTCFMVHRHDFTIVRKSICDQAIRKAWRCDRQGVIPNNVKRFREPLKQSAASLFDCADLTVPNFHCCDYVTAHSLTNRLVAKANTQNR